MRTRTSRRTGWPTAAHIRRTWRLRPSWIVIRSTPGRHLGDLRRCGQAVVELDAVAQPADRARRRPRRRRPRRGTPCRRRATDGRCGWPGRRRWSSAAGLRCPRRGGRRGTRAARRAPASRPSGGPWVSAIVVTHATRFVEQVVDEPRPDPDRHPVDLDRVDVDVDAPAEVGDLPVDGHAARRR